VPVGYYESVVGPDPYSGKKQLYRFRYVGFIPFATCPINPTGSAAACCADGSMPLYGLVFERGIMTFKPLGYEIQSDNTLVPVTETEAHVERAGQVAKETKISHAPPRAPSPDSVQLTPLPDSRSSNKSSTNGPARQTSIRVFEVLK
jgi:hypothetical protein